MPTVVTVFDKASLVTNTCSLVTCITIGIHSIAIASPQILYVFLLCFFLRPIGIWFSVKPMARVLPGEMGHGPAKDEVPKTTCSLPSFSPSSCKDWLNAHIHPPTPIPTLHLAVGMGVPIQIGRRLPPYRYGLLEWGCWQKFGPLQPPLRGPLGEPSLSQAWERGAGPDQEGPAVGARSVFCSHFLHWAMRELTLLCSVSQLLSFPGE